MRPKEQIGSMAASYCLLCHCEGAQLVAGEPDRWIGTCARCGRYQFDSAFADLVKHARANHDPLVLEQLARLARLVRRTREVLVIRRDIIVDLLHGGDDE